MTAAENIVGLKLAAAHRTSIDRLEVQKMTARKRCTY
jgi:hypothetical protein